MPTVRILLFQIFALLLAGSVAAQATLTDAVARYRQVIVQNNAQATQAAIQMFRAVLEAAPEEHRATVYIGSLSTSQAKHVWLPWKKLRYVNDGIDLMDKGVEALDCWTARITPVRSSMSLAPFQAYSCPATTPTSRAGGGNKRWGGPGKEDRNCWTRHRCRNRITRCWKHLKPMSDLWRRTLDASA